MTEIITDRTTTLLDSAVKLMIDPMAATWLLIFGLAMAWLVGHIVACLLKAWGLMLRSFNIRKAGWPPPYLDADGDTKDVTSQETSTEQQES